MNVSLKKAASLVAVVLSAAGTVGVQAATPVSDASQSAGGSGKVGIAENAASDTLVTSHNTRVEVGQDAGSRKDYSLTESQKRLYRGH